MIDLCRLLEDMVRAVVDHPDEVKVSSEEDSEGIKLILNVSEEDMGMVIGRHGNIARALRTVVKAAAKLSDQKVVVEIR